MLARVHAPPPPETPLAVTSTCLLPWCPPARNINPLVPHLTANLLLTHSPTTSSLISTHSRAPPSHEHHQSVNRRSINLVANHQDEVLHCSRCRRRGLRRCPGCRLPPRVRCKCFPHPSIAQPLAFYAFFAMLNALAMRSLPTRSELG